MFFEGEDFDWSGYCGLRHKPLNDEFYYLIIHDISLGINWNSVEFVSALTAM